MHRKIDVLNDEMVAAHIRIFVGDSGDGLDPDLGIDAVLAATAGRGSGR